MANRRLLFALVFLIMCPTAWAQDPVGPEFQVNSYTTGSQRNPAVASDASGNFVVVWHSLLQDGSSDIFGQRFDSTGVRQGNEFLVNTYTTGGQFGPAVASDASGNFVVVWESNGQDGSGSGVFGQRFNTAGLPQGSEFQVNTYTTNHQSFPAVASDASGNFVVVWNSKQDASSYGVVGQRFSASGVPQGSEFQVNTYTAVGPFGPKVASDANGNFVVVWTSFHDGSYSGVFGQRFSASGLPQGTEFQVNTYTTGLQNWPAVASDANGNFVVVWASVGHDGSDTGVSGQRFNASGLPQGTEFQVNTYTTSRQGWPAVASDANGSVVVVWASAYQDGSSDGVFGQRFNAAGLPQGSEFQVNSYTTGDQGSPPGPAVASAANGNFTVVWASNGQDWPVYDVFGQRFGDLIFRDGFQ